MDGRTRLDITGVKRMARRKGIHKIPHSQKKKTPKKHPISKNKDRKAAFNCRALFIIQPTMIKQTKKEKEQVEGYDRRGIMLTLQLLTVFLSL